MPIIRIPAAFDHPDWVFELKHGGSGRLPLYNLHGIQGKKTVYVLEGEACADALIALGLPATTTPSGAKNCRPEHAAQLKAAGAENVPLFPDPDTSGQEHVQTFARFCANEGGPVNGSESSAVPSSGAALSVETPRPSVAFP